jgi:hypothetical protein
LYTKKSLFVYNLKGYTKKNLFVYNLKGYSYVEELKVELKDIMERTVSKV